jgi:hypothetical protein
VTPQVVRESVDQIGPYSLQNEMPTYLLDLGLAYQLSGDVRQFAPRRSSSVLVNGAGAAAYRHAAGPAGRRGGVPAGDYLVFACG